MRPSTTWTAAPTADPTPVCTQWYSSLELSAGDDVPVRTRAWLAECLARAGVRPEHRGTVRRTGTELAREAALRAPAGDATVLIEIDVVGPIVRLSARGHAGTQRLGARVVEALQAAYEWGVERVTGGRRLVWCHLEVA